MNATTKDVSVERHVEQVVDGSHYRGYLMVAGTQLDYELVFGVPIPNLNDMEPAKTVTALRHVIQLTMKHNGADVELTDDEYNFFFQLVVMFAVDFYDDPQTRANNRLLHGRGSFAAMTGASTYIGMTSSGRYSFSPEICAILSTPKFGCALAD